MANIKVTELAAAASVTADDLIMVVDDPDGVPISKKATFLQFTQGIVNAIDADDIDDAATTNKFVTAADITKLGNLSGTNTGDQDLFASVVVDGDTITAGTPTDALTFVAGSNVTLEVNSSDEIVISATGGAGGGVESVNGVTPDSAGDVTIDADDISDAATTNKFVTAGDLSDIASALQPADIGVTVQAYDADILKADTPDELTAGFSGAVYNAGTKSSGTFTPDQDNGNKQRCVNGGAFTLAPPTDYTTVELHITNNGSAGTITTSGFTLVDGDAFTTTDTHEFICYLTTTTNGSATRSILTVKALQ